MNCQPHQHRRTPPDIGSIYFVLRSSASSPIVNQSTVDCRDLFDSVPLCAVTGFDRNNRVEVVVVDVTIIDASSGIV